MPYVIEDETGKRKELVVHQRPDDSHRLVYAHQASGGFLSNYHFRIDFSQDMLPPLTAMEKRCNYEYPSSEGVERRIMVSVILPLPFLKQLRDWLDRRVSEFEKEHGEIQVLKSEPPPAG